MDSCMIGEEDAAAPRESFRCFVCLDLLYKPIVLACGHISCFWCVHRAMNGFRESRCAICRQTYKYFPSICQLLHHLLLKIEPDDYKRREKEVLEEENKADCFSPQFPDCLPTEMAHAKENRSRESSSENDTWKQVSVSDVLCTGCKQLQIRPAVLNCGHVYCEYCMENLVSETHRCQVCQSLHPGALPKVCLDLDHYLEEQFPKEYALRRELLQPKQVLHQNGSPSCGLQTDEHKSQSSPCQMKDGFALSEDLSNAHIGVGCDTCGMYPIIGKRYKCKDCKEAVGFDLCEACYNTSSKVPGRFNQQHTPDHTFVLDESQMLCKILRLDSLLPHVAAVLPDDDDDLPNGDPEDPETPDSAVSNR